MGMLAVFSFWVRCSTLSEPSVPKVGLLKFRYGGVTCGNVNL